MKPNSHWPNCCRLQEPPPPPKPRASGSPLTAVYPKLAWGELRLSNSCAMSQEFLFFFFYLSSSGELNPSVTQSSVSTLKWFLFKLWYPPLYHTSASWTRPLFTIIRPLFRNVRCGIFKSSFKSICPGKEIYFQNVNCSWTLVFSFMTTHYCTNPNCFKKFTWCYWFLIGLQQYVTSTFSNRVPPTSNKWAELRLNKITEITVVKWPKLFKLWQKIACSCWTPLKNDWINRF